MSRQRGKFEFARFLNPALTENPLFKGLFEETSKLIDKLVVEPNTQTARSSRAKSIRRGDYVDTPIGRGQVGHIESHTEGSETYHVLTLNIGRETVKITTSILQQRETLIQTARDFGFDYFSDTLTNDDYERIIEYINSYWPASGQKSFVNFIGFLKNMDLEMVQLWDKDYDSTTASENSVYEMLEPLSPQRMQPVWKGGEHYPTSHVEINYDALHTPEPHMNDLVNLFYFMAPINLVLERINSYVNYEVKYGIASGGILTLTEEANVQDNLLDSDVLHIEHVALGLIENNPGYMNGFQSTCRDNEEAQLLYSRFVEQYSTNNLYYSPIGRSRIGLKCVVPAEEALFYFNCIVVMARLNGGETAPYSIHFLPFANPKFSTEVNRWGKTIYFMLELDVGDAIAEGVVDLSDIPLDEASFRHVVDFYDIDRPAREGYDQFYMQRHQNVPESAPHFGFTSEDQIYGVPLILAPNVRFVPSAASYYSFAEGEAPSHMEKVPYSDSNSHLDFEGKSLYRKREQ